MRPPIRPENGPIWGVSMPNVRKPDEVHFPPENAKKRPLSRSVTNCHQMRLMGSHLCAHETPAGKPRIHGIQWISWISWIFSGKRAIMRVCGVADAWIFCGFSRDTWIYPWMRPYPTNKARAKNGPLRRIRWGERPGVRISFCARKTQHPRHPGDIGDIGDIFRKAAKTLDFLHVRSGDIPGDIFGDGDFHAQDTLACAMHRSFDAPADKAQNGPLRRIHGTNARRPGETSPVRTFARKTPLRVRADAIGEPLLRTVRAASVCRLVGHPLW